MLFVFEVTDKELIDEILWKEKMMEEALRIEDDNY